MLLIIILLIAVTGFFLERYIFRRKWDKELSVKMSFTRRNVACGESCEVLEVIENRKNMMLPALEVKFSAPVSFSFEENKGLAVSDRVYSRNLYSIKGYKRLSRTFSFVPNKRGYYKIMNIEVLARDYFYADQVGKIIKNEEELIVYPRKVDTSRFEPLYRNMMGEIIINQRLIEDPFMFRGIREYRAGDPMKDVNQKSTAHTGRLLVNVHEATASYRICIILDGRVGEVYNPEGLKEEVISIASSIADRLLGLGMPVALRSGFRRIEEKKLDGDNNSEFIGEDFDSNKLHMDRIDEELAYIDVTKPVKKLSEVFSEAYEDYGRDKMYLIISGNEPDRVLEVSDEYARRGCSVYSIICARGQEIQRISAGLDERISTGINQRISTGLDERKVSGGAEKTSYRRERISNNRDRNVLYWEI